MRYKLVVGEKGNEYGHIVGTNARSLRGAKITLGRQLAAYRGDGWGKILCVHDNGQEEPMEEEVKVPDRYRVTR